MMEKGRVVVGGEQADKDWPDGGGGRRRVPGRRDGIGGDGLGDLVACDLAAGSWQLAWLASAGVTV